MLEFFRQLFSTDFMPHGYCLRLPEVILLHEISDAVIAVSYFLIPIALIWLLRRRRDIVYPWMFALFGIFILSCGTTHIMSIYTLWHPVYRLDGLIKAITALSSFPTAILLFTLVPKAVKLPSPEALRLANEALENEIAERKRGEQHLRILTDELEKRVAGRTRELDDSNRHLTETNAELQRVNADLKQFAFAASHDMQEPLRMVSIYSQLLERDFAASLGEKGIQFAKMAGDGARRMEQLIRDLLHYVEAADDEWTPKPCEAQRALGDALQNLKAGLIATNAEILADPLPAVLMDRTHLTQIFQNLLSNAIKYSRPEEQLRIHIGAAEQNGAFTFSIRDNGIGIAPQYHDQIFGMFKRLHGSSHLGTGVGLALCKKIVERYGGRIWVTSSEESAGSTFHFTVPAAARDAASLPTHSA